MMRENSTNKLETQALLDTLLVHPRVDIKAAYRLPSVPKSPSGAGALSLATTSGSRTGPGGGLWNLNRHIV